MRNLTTGAPAELMLLHPYRHADPAAALRRPPHAQVWRAYIRGKKVRAQDRLLPIARRPEHGASLADVLAHVGETPLPPYLKRHAEPDDEENYQTVYASTAGSAAAPTAGLHMTDRIMERRRERGVQMEDVVLHVGAGTFAPVTAETVGGHDMHAELMSLRRACVERVGRHVESRSPIFAMWTTSVRALESMYWFSVRLLVEEGVGARATIHVGQWEPYERMDELGKDALPTPHQAMQAVLQWHREMDVPIFGTT
ncbi:unnamed protein product [Chondrus crispus]|uniref:Uncharacterized protein n=1 Tax=Chondrus crispus TaxID=2769 RepID=R7QLU8_CHOCR|nr:unnamed protein product [Chondrus crispus]CDF39059.1 unnamed protein product [Chondrus crispus]|eukprot:XP_005718970.1 unnamed protein product [Chondrus crispus]